MFRWMKIMTFTGMLLALAACSKSGTPLQIATFPSGGEGEAYAPHPGGYVYSAQMEIEVFDPAEAASRAGKLADENGGYMVSSHTNRWDRQEQVTVVLAVPAYNFDSLHAALLRLGRLHSERISGGWDGISWTDFSEITVTFSPSGLSWPNLVGRWNPGRTLQRAFDVFLMIFGFLADLLIWAVVVVGPFVLIAWAVRRIWRWRRFRSS